MIFFFFFRTICENNSLPYLLAFPSLTHNTRKPKTRVRQTEKANSRRTLRAPLDEGCHNKTRPPPTSVGRDFSGHLKSKNVNEKNERESCSARKARRLYKDGEPVSLAFRSDVIGPSRFGAPLLAAKNLV